MHMHMHVPPTFPGVLGGSACHQEEDQGGSAQPVRDPMQEGQHPHQVCALRYNPKTATEHGH